MRRRRGSAATRTEQERMSQCQHYGRTRRRVGQAWESAVTLTIIFPSHSTVENICSWNSGVKQPHQWCTTRDPREFSNKTYDPLHSPQEQNLRSTPFPTGTKFTLHSTPHQNKTYAPLHSPPEQNLRSTPFPTRTKLTLYSIPHQNKTYAPLHSPPDWRTICWWIWQTSHAVQCSKQYIR